VPVQLLTFAVPVFRTTYSTRMLSAGIPLFAFQLAQKSPVPSSSAVTNWTSWKLPGGKFWAESQDTRLSTWMVQVWTSLQAGTSAFAGETFPVGECTVDPMRNARARIWAVPQSAFSSARLTT